MRHLIPLILLVVIIGKATAQDAYLVGTLPSLNWSKGLDNDWSLNLKVESRLRFLQGEFGGNASSNLDFQVADFALTTSRKTGLNNALAGGYLIRLRGEESFHRFIQQFTVVKRYETLRMAHRFSSDQTFNADTPWELRLRYRITAEVPLSGQSVDPGEFYLKLNNEYLNSWQEGEPDLEIRLVPLTGYEFTDNNKLEFGLDYRLSSFIDGNSRNSFWLNIGWYFKI
ncbi:MAG: DUF2490 domain-containing protein [Mariniphaga sp.]